MRDTLPSVSIASLSTIITTEVGMNIITTLLLAFIGGILGYFGKIFAEWLIKKFKK